MALGVVAVGSVPALAEESDGSYTCSGATFATAGVLAGTHSSVVVEGWCVVDSGPAVVRGDLTVAPGGVLLANFGKGNSRLTVRGDLKVRSGAAIDVGCLPTTFFSACGDDPTLSSHVVVGGDLISDRPLGVVVHNASIGGDVRQTGGGGGFTCTPSGPFAMFGIPVFSDYEDSAIRGDFKVADLSSCWLGLARVHVGGDATFANDQLADPDAIEILSNTIRGDLVCRDNSFVWDSADASSELFPRVQEPNTVNGERVGQCDVLQNPAIQGGSPGPLPF